MAWQLVKEVLDGAPPQLGPSERLVLVALAEWADVDQRVCWRTSGELAARVGVSEDGLRKVLQRLAKCNLDPRLPISFAASGSPVFAHKGRATTFRVPFMTAWTDPKGGTEVPPLNDPQAVSNSSTGGTGVPALFDAKAVLPSAKAVPQYLKGGTPVPPSPSETNRNQSLPREQGPSYPQPRDITAKEAI
ncbi:helix-turn-helix domain-containing protein [Rhodococcus sp. UNC363MFTsu5.1]|uniref:helix-turn-helix domain-containing protein n=1 Tax=Rhodococcus sp. UNC363MFTsu5.1 TaxID=1449069 RepID=UPI0012DDD8C8|nr:helix-turn-helix domain-containing protein [Rhodococcus sp. UNC363MFTsu5.1]